ncbi:MAG TPA: hypothetical protein VIM12_15195 [Noviherbaspirillum sp.]|jgi:hypothetical protein|uniref:hypothetical protein n=1 Tax=Noviherbaspirillum sp. TaxID=1926288 RepID=UPI002F92D0B9
MSQYVRLRRAARTFSITAAGMLLGACGGGGGDSGAHAGPASFAAAPVPTTPPASATPPTTPAPAPFHAPSPSPTPGALRVGPGQTYATPCAAFAAANHGAIIEIDAAGSYAGDVCAIARNNLTIRGVNGRPRIDAAGRNAMGKGVWVVQGANTTIENVEISGAKVADRNGAAIRLDGRHLTLRGSYLHDNENGILTSNDGVSDILIEHTEFANNGHGDGYSHNLYIGHVASLVFRYNYSHDARVGHNLKSRAQSNTITYNRFSSNGTGAPSYEIDLPNAGLAYVIGNVIQQPAGNQNPNMLSFGAEGATNTRQELYVVNNTFINDASSGSFINVGGSVSTAILVQNNVFAGPGAVTNQSSATQRTNYQGTSPGFVDRASYNLVPHSTSPLRNAGSAPGAGAAVSLAPTSEYRHVAGVASRVASGQIDIGAYEAP